MSNPSPTPNIKLQPINANRRTWADIMNANLALIDAVMGTFFVIQNLQGVWKNSTAYTVGQSVVDIDTSVVWQCQIAHTSSTIPTTFEEERALHTSYWTVYSSPARSRGVWMSETSYALNDFVVNGAQYAICVETHISDGSFAVDLAAGRWSLLVDLSAVGSTVLPSLGGAGDASKFVITSVSGNGYNIYSINDTLTILGATSIGRAVLQAGSTASALSAIGAQPAGSYQPLAASLTTLAGYTIGAFASTILAAVSAAAARTGLGLGSSAVLDVGTSANNVVQLDSGAKLPAVDGSQLTGVVNNSFTTGDVKLTFKTVADSGWIMIDDGSIGNASSGATNRANADTAALYALFWNNCADADAPVATGRGASASADFAANKAISLPKSLGRVVGFAGAGSGLTSRALGHVVGEETHVLASNHSEETLVLGNTTPSTGGGNVQGVSEQTAAGHNNMQPTTFMNGMIKL